MTIDETWHPEDDDLLAWLLDDLGGARREVVDSHVDHCPICADRLAELEEARGILGRLSDTPEHREDRLAIKARVTFEASAAPDANSFDVNWPGILLAIGIAILLVAWASPTVGRATSDSISSLLSIVAPDDTDRQAITKQTPPGMEQLPLTSAIIDGASLSFIPVAPEQLPGDLRLTGSSAESADTLQLAYQSDDGALHLIVTESPEAAGQPAFISGARSLDIDGISVAYLPNPVTEGVLRMYWTRKGIGFEVSIGESTGGDLSLDHAAAIVRHISEVQDQPIGGE